ncbi:MAG: YigZ family protein [Angelakisella sp.]|jgi:uncharacterized YigZ family protein|nr:YigZ family protein [Angelakisella sp.]MCI9529052.1 YigZ family protein [Angelakisella sp.]
MDGYRTIEAPARDEFIERRSRFIGHIAPVATDEEAVAFVNAIREQHREATHNVYAYVLRQDQLTRFSDDGEPQGTAGKPVLEVVLREGLVDVAVVVTRYFGGILLGAGGLVRAYAQGAKTAIDAARVLNMQPAALVELDMGYDFYGKATYILPQYEVQVTDSRFEEGVRLQLLCKTSRLTALTHQLRELSSGTVAPVILDERFAHFPEGGPA